MYKITYNTLITFAKPVRSDDRESGDSRLERLDPKGYLPLGRQSHPSYRIISTLGTLETGRKTTVDIRHTLTQFGDWNGPSRPLSSACTQGTVVLSAHLKRIGISDTSLCECGQADQTPDHVLQSCPKYAKRRQLTWRQGADLATKLWGSAEDLYRTAGFVASTGLKI